MAARAAAPPEGASAGSSRKKALGRPDGMTTVRGAASGRVVAAGSCETAGVLTYEKSLSSVSMMPACRRPVAPSAPNRRET